MRKKILIAIPIILFLFCWFYYFLPATVFDDPCSTIIEDRNGTLLGAKIADDGQWRFPYNENIPEKFKQALVLFEDRNFFYHPGVNIQSLLRALKQNISAGEIVSGGSTISMQVIRLSRKGKPRTIGEKIIEIILALRLELSKSKEEILALYASNAPFGGNVVGLDAASWRYFGTSPDNLSWAESATLAVLPNSPSLIHPGRNREKLQKKRDRLLDRLAEKGIITKSMCELSKTETLPEKPHQLPQFAPHLLIRTYLKNKGRRIKTTLNLNLQNNLNELIERHHNILKSNEIHNAAAIIIDVEKGEVLAYVGNTSNHSKPEFAGEVDVIPALRSTGSILKPFLFASMLNAGEILPNTLIADIPTQIAGYVPKNYNRSYDGAVPAKMALSRSLNIPAVRMLQFHGVNKFHHLLKNFGMNSLIFSPNHYGLTLILGGAEGSLWDMAGMYASMARVLNSFSENSGKYSDNDIHPPFYILDQETNNKESENLKEDGILSAASIYLTFDALLAVNRPSEEDGWDYFSSSENIAWKTGTSFGFRDAWAIGVTPDYVVGVWVGNADGEGRPGLTGIKTAAPIMFDIFSLLPQSEWFLQPFDEMKQISICQKSGHRASSICNPVDSMWVQLAGLRTSPCPYHKTIHLDKNNHRVTSDCENVTNMIHQSWFVLPPVQELYYKFKNSDYIILPPFRDDCENKTTENSLQFIFPKENSKISIPIELDGSQGKAIFEAAHRFPETKVFWHLDETYIGLTENYHQMEVSPPIGKHSITIVDENGERISIDFEIIDK
ncbi:MAG: penicillin-binding protein 1C [Bacteroidales bacterium]|nr:penicillin-binding protein 1C [Bacteroidales bacterium]